MQALADKADFRNSGSISHRLRGKRFRLFEQSIAPLEKPLRILDVGGTESFWQAMGSNSIAVRPNTRLQGSIRPLLKPR